MQRRSTRRRNFSGFSGPAAAPATSSSEGPPEYELATSPLQMLAGVVITLSAHLEASAQLLREESKLTADCRSTPRSLRFYAFSNSRKSATALPSLEEILEVVLTLTLVVP